MKYNSTSSSSSVHLIAGSIAKLHRAIGDPRKGLPEHVFEFVSRITPLVNVDLWIQDPDYGTLLTWRDDEIYGSGWHVPGGIIRFKETTAERIKAVAREELGAEVIPDPAPMLIHESISQRDTRGHFIALIYRCRLESALDENLRASLESPERGQWRWHQVCPSNIIEVHAHYARFF